jgi:thioredoxin 1
MPLKGACLEAEGGYSWWEAQAQRDGEQPGAPHPQPAHQDQWERIVATVTLTKDNISSIINDNAIVIIDFWAEWCGPCKRFAPVFEEISEKYPDIIFAKVNTEEEPEVAGYFQIRAIPTLAVFRDQVGIYQNSGALPPHAFEELIGQVQEVDMDEVRKKIAAEQSTPTA